MKNMKAYGIDLFGKAWFLHMLNQKKKMTQISPFSGGKKKIKGKNQMQNTNSLNYIG